MFCLLFMYNGQYLIIGSVIQLSGGHCIKYSFIELSASRLFENPVLRSGVIYGQHLKSLKLDTNSISYFPDFNAIKLVLIQKSSGLPKFIRNTFSVVFNRTLTIKFARSLFVFNGRVIIFYDKCDNKNIFETIN